MRPVNLIPPEERRGEHRPMRSGPVVYIVVGALIIALAGVTALVLTGNEIADRKAEVVTLKHEDAAARARAERLAAYTQFQAMSEQRAATVTNLANSRFDWERVMRELALILPDNVWLMSLSASASPGASVGGESSSSGSALGGSVQGPSLELSGCTAGQDAVAGFVTALKDIDGVTRVGLASSAVGGQSSSSSEGGGGGCQTRDFIAQFSLVVAFDAAPAPVTEAEAAPEAEATETSSSEGSEETGEGG
jgi:Tfp pilus assembly protein PilN